MDREGVLRSVRDRFEVPIWSLLRELEASLLSFSSVPYVDIADQRAVGSTLNCAMKQAADAIKLGEYGLEVVYCQDGRSNKLAGTFEIEGFEYTLSMELHLAGPRGGTSKSAHQFAGVDIDSVMWLPGFDVDAPKDLLFFIACHLSPTGVSIARTFLKFADGVDQRSVRLDRPIESVATDIAAETTSTGSVGTKLVLKHKGEDTHDGIATDQRRDAAPGSK